LYAFGKYAVHGSEPTQKAMLFKIDTQDGSMIFQSTFDAMDDIMAYVQPNGTDYLLGCGQDSSLSNPGIWKIYSNGKNGFYWNLNLGASSSCQGLTYDEASGKSTMLVLSDLDSFKKFSKGYTASAKDAFLVTVSDYGSVSSAIQISFSTSYSSLNSGNLPNTM
jgi:hypothetical protein